MKYESMNYNDFMRKKSILVSGFQVKNIHYDQTDPVLFPSLRWFSTA